MEQRIRRRKNNRGSTMVEVLVAFSLLLLLLGGLTKIIHVSSNLLMQTKDLQVEQETFCEKYYRQNQGGLQKKTVLSAGPTAISFEEVDVDGNHKANGDQIALTQTEIISFTDDETATTMYQVKHKN